MSRRTVPGPGGSVFTYDVDDGIRDRATGYAYCMVTEELMREAPGWHRAVREALRNELDAMRSGLRITRFMLDPVERHGVLEAPMRRAGTHVVFVTFSAP